MRPFPGGELALRVAGTTDRDWFFESGRRSVHEIAAVLALVGRTFADYQSVLDFGCGCGRMLTWLDDAAASGTRLHGTDIDAEAIAWVNEQLPFVDARANGAMPPLPFDDSSFDLVFNHSVFTHIDEPLQDAWLADLHRVTRPGSHLVLSAHGEHAFAAFEDALAGLPDDPRDGAALRRRYDKTGFVFVAEDSDGRFPDWYGNAYHATAYLFAHWSRWFRIRAYVPRGALDYQDLVLLERVAELDDAYQRAAQPTRDRPRRTWLRRTG